MSTILNLPDIRPSLLLDFANSGRVDPRIQCTRASSATCFGPDGKLRTVAANVPRIDFDPLTGQCKGLLVEEARTNLLLGSLLTGAVGGAPGTPPTGWSLGTPATGSTALTSSIFGSSDSGQAVTFTTASGSRVFYSQAIAVTAGVQYTLSVYVEAVSGTNQYVTYPANGTATVTINSEFEALNPTTIGRKTVVFTANSSGTINIRIGSGVANSANGGSVTLSRPQLEEGVFPTSYIPTEASAVTRVADFVQMTGANFSSWYRQDEGTLFADYVLGEKLNNSRAVSLAGTGVDRIDIVSGTSSGTGAYSEAVVSGVVQTTKPQATTNTPNHRFRLAFAYRKDDCNGARNGSVSTDSTSAAIPAVSTLTFGSSQSGSNSLCGHIRRVIFYAQRLPNNQLQRLTA